MRRLTGPEIGEVRNILLARFNLMSIRTFTEGRVEIPYDNYVAPLAGLQDGIFQYISQLNSDWNHYKLINAFLAEYPDDPDMLRFAAEFGIQTSIVDHQNKQLEGFNSLEKLVNANPFLDIDNLLNNISRVERTVCRIQTIYKNGDTGWGTGFLVGADLLMSNYHVFQTLINEPENIEAIHCLFDYKVSPDGKDIHRGKIVSLVDDAVQIYSEVGTLDAKGSDDLNSNWEADKLDYAIVRLKDKVGDEAFGPGNASGDSAKRGWLSFPEPIPPIFSGSHAIIVQHPQGGPKKIAFGFGKMLGMDDRNTRVRYNVNTQGGSSGSPCFNHKFELIVLHNAGDPNYNPVYNQGIPIARIKEDLDAKGFNL